MAVHVGCLVERVTVVQVFLRVLRFCRANHHPTYFPITRAEVCKNMMVLINNGTSCILMARYRSPSENNPAVPNIPCCNGT